MSTRREQHFQRNRAHGLKRHRRANRSHLGGSRHTNSKKVSHTEEPTIYRVETPDYSSKVVSYSWYTGANKCSAIYENMKTYTMSHLSIACLNVLDSKPVVPYRKTNHAVLCLFSRRDLRDLRFATFSVCVLFLF